MNRQKDWEILWKPYQTVLYLYELLHNGSSYQSQCYKMFQFILWHKLCPLRIFYLWICKTHLIFTNVNNCNKSQILSSNNSCADFYIKYVFKTFFIYFTDINKTTVLVGETPAPSRQKGWLIYNLSIYYTCFSNMCMGGVYLYS